MELFAKRYINSIRTGGFRTTENCGTNSACGSFSSLQATSYSFKTAANLSRTGFVTPETREWEH